MSCSSSGFDLSLMLSGNIRTSWTKHSFNVTSTINSMKIIVCILKICHRFHLVEHKLVHRHVQEVNVIYQQENVSKMNVTFFQESNFFLKPFQQQSEIFIRFHCVWFSGGVRTTIANRFYFDLFWFDFAFFLNE